ncbi:hypothetical protein D9M70_365240 [compost metagenome]
MKPNPITDAIGVLKLADMHFHNTTAVSAETVHEASLVCIQRLEAIDPRALELVDLFTKLFRLTPAGWLPHVTLTADPVRPYGAVITDEAGNIAARDTGKSIEGLVHLISARLPVGRGEAAA